MHVHKLYLHSDKDSNWEDGQRMGLDDEAIADQFKYALYEVEFEVAVDMDTGEYQIISVTDLRDGEHDQVLR